MNKISMDALDAGWSIGFGTRVPRPFGDFTYDSVEETVEPTPQGRRAAVRRTALARLLQGIEDGILMMARPAAY